MQKSRHGTHRAVINNIEEIQSILTHNFELVNATDKAGQLPLHWAARVGSLQSVTLLIEADKGSVNCADELGNKPLIRAVERGFEDVTLFLYDQYVRPLAVGDTARSFIQF